TFALVVSWVTYSADYSRYLPLDSSRRRVALASAGGSTASLVGCGLLGAAIQTADPGRLLPNLIVASVPVAFAYCFAAFIILAELSSNYLNVYSAAMCALAIGIEGQAVDGRHRRRGPGRPDRGPGPLRRQRLPGQLRQLPHPHLRLVPGLG
ncbi:permease for cytosine/purines, uracil, thiamine, allantoin, partial [mine drainage metagenome]